MNVVDHLMRLLLSVLLAQGLFQIAMAGENDVLNPIRPFIANAVKEFNLIPIERQKQLQKAAVFIRSKIKAGETAQLTFICTHNSRRSHLAQIWTQTAAAY